MTLARRTVFAGFCGGLLAGGLDTVATLWASAALPSASNRVHLLLADCGLAATAGSLLALAFVGLALASRRLLGQARWSSPAHAAALTLASPLLVYDAFALFRGTQASRIRAHGLLSILLVGVGGASLWLAVTLWSRLLARARPKTRGITGGGDRRYGPIVIACLLIVAEVGAGWANRAVLPRLYGWFHVSLSLFQLASCILAIRLLLEMRRRIPGKRESWIVALAASALLLAGTWVERPVLAKSQGLRLFVFEKTQLASVFSRLLPAGRSGLGKAISGPRGEVLPPLPAGPHYPDADIVLITIDALRPDHLGCYGYARPTSPNIDALAGRGVRFEHAYAQAPHTSFSLASIMIGKYYPTLARLAPSDTHDTLAKILRRYDRKTAAFFPPAVFYIDAHKMKAFEESSFDFEYVKYEYLGAEDRIGQIDDFLRAVNPVKLFLWLHLFEPHEPYERHAGFDFGERDIDRYDSEIAYADSVVGKVVALLERRRPGAVIILAADHGEEFEDHGGRYHGSTLFEEQERVPLIVVAPGLHPHAVSGQAQLVDIPATVLGLLNLPVPARMRGTDLGPWLASPPAPPDRLPPAFAEVEDKRMIVLGSDKLICDTVKDYCSYFDLSADPHERHDLADERPERVAMLRQRLAHWLGQQTRYETNLVGAAGSNETYGRVIARAHLGDATAALPLATMLTGKAPVAVRREAATLLATNLPPRPETQEALLAAAKKADDEEVRDWAAVAALRLGTSTVQERLHALLLEPTTKTKRALRVQAAFALAERSDPAGVPVLNDALEDCDHDVRLCRKILAALASLKDRRAVHPLIRHLAFVQTRRETVKALASIGDRASYSALIGRLESDPYVLVRVAAAQALGRLGGVRAHLALQRALAHEREEMVLVAVREALAGHDRGR